MEQWFETKVRYTKILDSGLQKKVTEPYLIDSLSFTESEEKTIEAVTPYIDGEFTIKAIQRSNIAEVFEHEEGEPYYKVRIDFITLNEKTGAEHRTQQTLLVQSPSVDKVLPLLHEHMKGSTTDYEPVLIQKTAIQGVVRYKNS